MTICRTSLASLLVCLVLLSYASVHAEDAPDQKATRISLAGGKIQLTMPATWEKKQPTSNIVEYEFEAPAADADTAAARVTIMGAGGSVEANIDRWKSQFVKEQEGAMKSEETKVAGQVVHLVDFSGDYNDARGPFVPGVVRENYRMMAAIVVTEKLGQYFIKAYGPAATMEANKKAFHEMVQSLEVK